MSKKTIIAIAVLVLAFVVGLIVVVSAGNSASVGAKVGGPVVHTTTENFIYGIKMGYTDSRFVTENCIALQDSATSSNTVYLTVTGSTVSATTTRPTKCTVY